MTSEDFCTKLIMDKHVAVVPGTALWRMRRGFCKNVSYSYSLNHLKTALQRIRDFIEEQKNGN